MRVEASTAAAGERVFLEPAMLSADGVRKFQTAISAMGGERRTELRGVMRAIENLGCRSVTRSAGDVAMRRECSQAPAR
jgi:hypothetical protein